MSFPILNDDTQTPIPDATTLQFAGLTRRSSDANFDTMPSFQPSSQTCRNTTSSACRVQSPHAIGRYERQRNPQSLWENTRFVIDLGRRIGILVPITTIFFGVCISGCGSSKPAKESSTASQKKDARAEKPRAAKSEPKPSHQDVEQPALSPPTAAVLAPETFTPPERVVRPADSRPVYDAQKLNAQGFQHATSKHLVLYSDLPTAEIESLPKLIDQLDPQLEAYFGPLPPAPDRKPYQMTGFLMTDAQRFIDAGLLPEGRVQPHEGWYRDNEFWWNRQPSDYYTRHLLLHEATHCFMHVMPAVDCPPWYVEGMAEWFGTHLVDRDGKLRIGVLPDSPDQFPGWARISVIQDEVKAGRLLTVDQILTRSFNDFQALPAYAWSWALCHFLNTHPRYQTPFREVARHLYDGGFTEHFETQFKPHLADLRFEWLLFASQVQYGHDIVRGEIQFTKPAEMGSTDAKTVQIAADRGWQATGIKLVPGNSYLIQASGRITLAETTKPWMSEPQGISIRYVAGHPLGRLIACIRPDTVPESNGKPPEIIPIGPRTLLKPATAGTLFLRINDAWNELKDNTGAYDVRIQLGHSTKD